VQRPRAVLPRAPRQQNLHRYISGCNTRARASAARPRRGPAAIK
jgi:hypothetical protein